jgi:hypothetical protein
MVSVFGTTRKGGLAYPGRSIHHKKLITKKAVPNQDSLFFTVYVSPLLYRPPQKTSFEVQESLQWTVNG